ncbi:Lysine-specific demethylase JMJ25 [Camellia lanceoleosa]|uniref:Lysine-specific demethylase JMJ25 n=1 Tax=Camellia lanceoleosa TaxID=1840588 RepID=A0ACC0I934_9ERIC|nr:Lysine-specific demethylase JMJ25 [Camellia lanceoleosa]
MEEEAAIAALVSAAISVPGLSLAALELQKVACEKDERVYCNYCKTSVVDFHRSCPNCFYDLCLTCCREVRDGHLQGGFHLPSGVVASSIGALRPRSAVIYMQRSSMPSKPLKYLRYAMTTFGSICYGSLFTAAIWTLRWKVESSVSAPTDGQNTRGLAMAQAPSNMVGHLSHFHTNYEENH